MYPGSEWEFVVALSEEGAEAWLRLFPEDAVLLKENDEEKATS